MHLKVLSRMTTSKKSSSTSYFTKGRRKEGLHRDVYEAACLVLSAALHVTVNLSLRVGSSRDAHIAPRLEEASIETKMALK